MDEFTRKPRLPRQHAVESIVRVVDGDTIVIVVELDFGISYTSKCRMAHINAPEMSTPEGPPARGHLVELISRAGAITGVFHGKDKYGRELVEVVGEDGQVLNDRMVADGHASPCAFGSEAYTGGLRNLIEDVQKEEKC